MNKQERALIKEELVITETLSRYYGSLAERFNRCSRLSLFGIAALSLTAVIASLMDPAGISLIYLRGISVVPVTLSVVVVLAALWISYADYSRHAGTAAGIASVCMDLVDEWEALLFSSDEDVAPRARDLKQRINKLTSVALMEHGFENRKLHKRYYEEAKGYWNRVLAERED